MAESTGMLINGLVVLAYLVGMILIGIYLTRHIKKADDFFLAGRSLNRWVIAGTVMATNVAAVFLVGPAGAAYAGGGAAVLLIAWTGNMIAAVSALVIVPRLRRLEISTVSEFLEDRYGLWLRLLPAALWIVYYALFAGNNMYTLSVTLQPVLGDINLNTITLFVGGGVIVYCFFSGLLAVAYTSVIQAFLMIIGGLILLPLALRAVGGISGFAETVPPEHFVFWKPAVEDSAWPNYKQVIMFALLGLPYWCTSQYMIQRAFAGRTVKESSRGIMLAAILTGPLTLSYIIPGICAAVLYKDTGILENPDMVLSQLLQDLLPVGLGGLFIAALVAASHSTASALLNSLATLAEHDFYRRFLPDKSSNAYLWFGRGATLVGGLVGMVFAFNVDRLGGIIQANFTIMGFFEPPIFVIVAAALFYRKANAWGALASIVLGVGFSSVTALMGMPPEDRTIWVFPICIVAMAIGSMIGQKVQPETVERRSIVDDMLERSRTVHTEQATPMAIAGIVIAAIALVAFIGCAFFESYLPMPGNILINMAFMIIFVLGCYMASPAFVPETEDVVPHEASSIERSWFHVLFGSGWSWLVLYVLCAILVLTLYFM